MMDTVYLNGAWVRADEARISPLDRGFLFADGIYEVIPVYGGTPFRVQDHLARLERSLAAVSMTNPRNRSEWQALFGELIEHNGGGNQALYLQITRGAATGRDHGFPAEPVEPTVFVMSLPVSAPAADTPDTATGVAAITRDDIRWSRCDIKSVSLLPNILLRQQAQEAGAAEAILVRDGFVTEGSASNIFVVNEDGVTTPPRSHAILGGITRDLVLELCREDGLAATEREVAESELREAHEIWLTSSTKEVVPVVTLNGAPVGAGQPGEHWKHLVRAYVEFKRRLCGLE